MGSLSYISITDSGCGFDVKKVISENKNAGIEIVRKRLEQMCNGSFVIESEMGKGTKVLITIPDAEEGMESYEYIYS